MGYPILADLVLLVHFLFVLFVVLGLMLILVGGAFGWRWVRDQAFRVAHLLAFATSSDGQPRAGSASSPLLVARC